MLSIRPVTSRLFARLGKRHLVDAAVERRVIAPPVERPSKPLISLPDEADRTRGHHPDSTPSTNLARLRCEPVRQGESFALRLRDVIIADGTVMARTALSVVAERRRRMLLRSPVEQLDEGTFCSTYVTERYFGHWLKDGLSHELWARDQGSQPLVLTSPPGRVHEPGYRQLSGLAARHVDTARVGELWYLHDHELSDDRVARLQRIRARIRAAVPADGPSHVFMSRGSSGAGRTLANEAEVEAMLTGLGFAILKPETSTPWEIARTLSSARVVISPEGSALSHAVMTAPQGTTLVVLQPPFHLNMIYKTFADALDFHFAYAVGDPVSEDAFVQPLDRLRRLLDIVDRLAQRFGVSDRLRTLPSGSVNQASLVSPSGEFQMPSSS
ncbi:glycosyltransferase family 61 protein [Sphingomonas arenae]|uniref:glycosyltransferase family 61 protein n=1 Tax=Sphingomonas arenae TaxID=2812555 RepID=UPI0019677A23|nr:glycosyltransferase family 61 protein [Sphingomonas arenae]